MKYTPPYGILYQFYPELPYHNIRHTDNFDYSSCPSIEAQMAAWFHDIQYDPLSSQNEETAIALFKKIKKEFKWYDPSTKKVESLILSTKDHVESFNYDDKDMSWLHANDLAYLRETDDVKIVETEKKIFKEYQFVPFRKYRARRIELLRYYSKHLFVSDFTVGKIIDFLSGWTPKIGIYAGSFNPIHAGHYDIIQQAEQVFDKIIIAQGQNEEKEKNTFDLDVLKTIQYYEKEKYEGGLFDFLTKKQIELGHVSLVRGLRNNDDLEHETSLFNYQQDFISVPSVYFIAKSQFRHISSGAIRTLQKLGKDTSKYLIS